MSSAVARPAGREDVALLTRLREEWAAEQRGGPVDDPGFAPATSLMVNDLS